MTFENSYEALMAQAPEGWWKEAIIDVLDTAYIVRQWFKAHKVEASAADITAMTALICQTRARQGSSDA
jgi:hypothetical protein